MNDYARLLGPNERGHLETLLVERERATGAQMVIAIFRSLKGEAMEDFSIRLAERWRIGQKGLDNGVILLVFVRDRKVRLEVGYGLEQVIPDAVAGQIIREVIAPRFRERRYVQGLEGAINAVFGRVGAAKTPPKPPPEPPPLLIPWLLTPVGFGLLSVLMFGSFIFVFFVLPIILISKFGPRAGYTVGAGSTSWTSSGSSWGGSSFSIGGSFTGGGGSFGGGGASGGW